MYNNYGAITWNRWEKRERSQRPQLVQSSLYYSVFLFYRNINFLHISANMIRIQNLFSSKFKQRNPKTPILTDNYWLAIGKGRITFAGSDGNN